MSYLNDYDTLLKTMDGLSVLDVGSVGQNRKGSVSAKLRKIAKSYTSIDTQPGATFQGDAATMKLSYKFDAIFCGDIIEHVPNQSVFIQNMRDHLKENGALIIVTPDINNIFTFIDMHIAQNEEHVLGHNRKTITRLLKLNGFDAIYILNCWKYKRKLWVTAIK